MIILIIFVFLAIFLIDCSSSEKADNILIKSKEYDDLVALWREFRDFQKPKVVNGVPVYTKIVMKEKESGLDDLQKRLAAIDPSGWSVSKQADYHIVRAEMNGLEFQHRVLKPWSRNPAFYDLDLLTRGYSMYGLSGISEMPLSTEGREELRTKLKAIKQILEQARENLTDMVDLSRLAIYNKEKEMAILGDLKKILAEHHPELVEVAEQARKAVEEYIGWVKANKDDMAKYIGVGKENYNWWLKNVWLLPYTWEEIWIIERREYERAVATLKFYENKNRKLPLLNPVKTEEEFNRRWKEAEELLLKFVQDEEIFTVPDYLVPTGPEPFKTWATNPGRYGPVNDFFEQLGDHDPMTEIIHNTTGHNFDGLRSNHDSRPIRGAQRLYGLDRVRSEGIAFGLEEMMMHAGLFDKRLRGDEIVTEAMAYRAVRGMADLKMHANELTFDEACQFDVDWCPRGWVQKYSFTMMAHKGGTPNMPGNEISYLIGKIQIDKLISDLAIQIGDKFNLHKFFDDFFAAGMIPISLIRWEMTGFDDEVKKLW